MKRFYNDISMSNAALAVGVAFITSVIIVSIVDDFLLPNFVVPGDNAALAKDIAANHKLFIFAIIGYFIVLILDSIIALALYIVLRPAGARLALIVATLRLLYALVLMIGLMLLVLQVIDVYGYSTIKLCGYVFFSQHILFLGVAVFKSGYIPKSLGLFLMLASLTYIVFFVDLYLSEVLEVVTMLVMALAELSLSIWLLVRRKSLPVRDGLSQ